MNIKKIESIQEKTEEAANLIEQAKIANAIGDSRHFSNSMGEAGDLLFEVSRILEKEKSKWDDYIRGIKDCIERVNKT